MLETQKYERTKNALKTGTCNPCDVQRQECGRPKNAANHNGQDTGRLETSGQRGKKDPGSKRSTENDTETRIYRTSEFWVTTMLLKSAAETVSKSSKDVPLQNAKMRSARMHPGLRMRASCSEAPTMIKSSHQIRFQTKSTQRHCVNSQWASQSMRKGASDKDISPVVVEPLSQSARVSTNGMGAGVDATRSRDSVRSML